MRRRIGLGSFYLTTAKQSLALDLKSTERRKVVLELATYLTFWSGILLSAAWIA